MKHINQVNTVFNWANKQSAVSRAFLQRGGAVVGTLVLAIAILYSPQSSAQGSWTGAQICKPLSDKNLPLLAYRTGYIRNKSRTKYLPVVCALSANRGRGQTHYMEVVIDHHISNINNSKPFVVTFRLQDNVADTISGQTAIVDRPGERYRLDTTDAQYGTENFETPAGQINWVPIIQISIPPLSRVYAMYYINS